MNCETVFGNKTYHYCVKDSYYSSEVIRCNDCKSGVGGYAGQKHCGGWNAGWDFGQDKPTGGLEDTGNYTRTVLYGKCNEDKNLQQCGRPDHIHSDNTSTNTNNINQKCRNKPNIEVHIGNKNIDFGKNKSWKTCTGYKTIFQGDGNFVVYNPSGRAVWASNTHGKGGKILAMQADGNLVIYASGGKPIWSSNTHGNPVLF